jgi:hypothetical protein
VWGDRLRLNVVVIRAIYVFLLRIGEAPYRSPVLRRRSGRQLIKSVARTLNVELSDADFSDFVSVESRLQSIAYGIDEARGRMFLRWFLRDWPSLAGFRSIVHLSRRIAASVRARLAHIFVAR